MDPRSMAEHSDPAWFGGFVAGIPRREHMAHNLAQSVREADFRNHHIVIQTSFVITVDGEPLAIHVGLSNDGSAHCHALPAYQFASAIDMVRALIDFFPDDFPVNDAHGRGPDTQAHEKHSGPHPGEM